jgi:uncharacterized membrane protein YgdD (TMEM256/DUF423 family)
MVSRHVPQPGPSGAILTEARRALARGRIQALGGFRAQLRGPVRRRIVPLMPSNYNWFSRFTIFLAGILGAAGVAAAAGASHTDDPRVLGALALIALSHAPALLSFGLSSVKGRVLRVGAIVVATGACFFCADLATRHFLGSAFFPMSAPFSGTAIIVGWFIVAAGGLCPHAVVARFPTRLANDARERDRVRAPHRALPVREGCVCPTVVSEGRYPRKLNRARRRSGARPRIS